jgi:hypothetical protein
VGSKWQSYTRYQLQPMLTNVCWNEIAVVVDVARGDNYTPPLKKNSAFVSPNQDSIGLHFTYQFHRFTFALSLLYICLPRLNVQHHLLVACFHLIKTSHGLLQCQAHINGSKWHPRKWLSNWRWWIFLSIVASNGALSAVSFSWFWPAVENVTQNLFVSLPNELL